MKIFGREPALWIALAATAIRLVSAFWIDLSVEQQSALNAVVAAAGGLLIAAMVKDGIHAAILGLANAMIALSIGFGLRLDGDQQALIMSFVGLLASAFIRTQAVAPVPATRV